MAPSSIIEYFGFPEDTDVEDELLDFGIELCGGCNWWFYSFELIPDDDEDEELTGYCEDCRKERSEQE